MKLHIIHAGFFKLDGGAMFGVVPKKLWQKLNPPDANNLCTWAMRCLLIETGDRKILIDSGMGEKQSEKFFGHYEPHGPKLLDSLAEKGFSPEDITDHLLTHLHFDHCGGSVRAKQDGSGYESVFPNATCHVSKGQWESAQNPNPRERASFLKENILPLEENGRLNIIENEGELLPGINLTFAWGHTDGMIIPLIQYKGRTLAYMADLLPSSQHLPLPFVMAYDIRPLNTMEEKKNFLQKALDENWTLFFEHDPEHECCTLQQGPKYIEVKERFPLSAIN